MRLRREFIIGKDKEQIKKKYTEDCFNCMIQAIQVGFGVCLMSQKENLLIPQKKLEVL